MLQEINKLVLFERTNHAICIWFIIQLGRGESVGQIYRVKELFQIVIIRLIGLRSVSSISSMFYSLAYT